MGSSVAVPFRIYAALLRVFRFRLGLILGRDAVLWTYLRLRSSIGSALPNIAPEEHHLAAKRRRGPRPPA